MPHLSVLLLSVFLFFSVTLACTPPHTQSGLSRWSDASTWPGGTLPAAGSKVDIAEGLKVLYDLDQSPIYAEINVYGALIFDEKTTPVELRTENIFIHDGGLLQIGGECCFYNGKAIITLYQPSNTAYNPYLVGTKVLGVLAGGSLELFGKIPDPTWTVLAADANKGDTEITLDANVEGWWNVNDTIVLATTDFNVDQNEERKIVSIVGSTLTLDSPLTYSHSGAIYGYADERGEVAVLDRKILIRGDNSSEANGKFGGHVMAIKDFNHVYVQGVEFTKAGQYNKKGRYPIHFHMCGDVIDRAYVKDCSFHHNFQRSITIHGTHHLIVRRNVAYDTLGHSYFIEDGIETGNELSWNLGIRARAVANSEVILSNGLVQGGILLSDDEPAVFWITNPNNTVRNNVAVGATFGFWGAFPVNPTGPSATFSVYPRRTPLLEFAYNKAHSMNSDGLFVDRGPDNSSDPVGGGYTPLNDPTNSSSGAREAVFSTFTAYKCRNRGAWLRGGLVKVENSVFADNAIGITFAINSYSGIIEDSVFYGETDNMGNPPTYETKGPDGRSLPKPYSGNASLLWPIRGIEYYDGPVSFNNCHFYKFFNIPTIAGTRVCSGMSMLREDQFSISPSNDANQMAFYDESGNQIQHVYFPDYKHDGDFAVAFVDLDGSVTGRPPSNGNRAAVINKNQVLATPNCDTTVLSTWNAFVCPDHFGALGIRYNGISTMPNVANGQTEWIKLYREDLGSSKVYGVCGGACPPVDGMDTSFFATVVKNRGWLYHFTQPASTFVPSDLEVNLQYTDKGDFIIVGFCYPAGTTITSISYNYKNQNLTAYATNRAALDNAPDNNDDYGKRGSGLWTKQDGNGYIWVKMYPYAARDSTNYRNAYPAAQFRLKVTPGNGAPNCAINIKAAVVAEKPLPPKGSVPAPAAFATPTYAFVDRTANEQCDAFQGGDSSASSLSPAFWLSLFW